MRFGTSCQSTCPTRRSLRRWEIASTPTKVPKEEVMAFSEEYRLVRDAEGEGTYRIVDDEGCTYAFDPDEWDYDEQADGWDGERWADGWDD